MGVFYYLEFFFGEMYFGVDGVDVVLCEVVYFWVWFVDVLGEDVFLEVVVFYLVVGVEECVCVEVVV